MSMTTFPSRLLLYTLLVATLLTTTATLERANRDRLFRGVDFARNSLESELVTREAKKEHQPEWSGGGQVVFIERAAKNHVIQHEERQTEEKAQKVIVTGNESSIQSPEREFLQALDLIKEKPSQRETNQAGVNNQHDSPFHNALDLGDQKLHHSPAPINRSQRFKRQQSMDHKLSLPAVPMPLPPPFPASFSITPFGSATAKQSSPSHFINAFAQSSGNSGASQGNHATSCGGILKARHGIIQTPNFPHKFTTPIECVWVIDASELPAASSTANISIVVYLTQLYVLGGLKFTEYMYYSDDYKVPAHRVFTLTEDDVTQVAWVQFNSQYLEIRFVMPSLDGTHLRALDRLLDVYGFNITYEVQDDVKSYQCNTLQCRFLGHCYAKEDFGSYYCSCFPGFSGIDCGRGPLCEDPHTNICQNGGTCKHIGDAAITCHCPSGYKGTKCEIPEINEITMGCTANSTASDCHRECDFEKSFAGMSLIKASKSSGRSGKTRYEVTIRLGANLTAYYRNTDTERRPNDHLPSLLERHLMRVLRNFNITKISDLELISNTTDRLDITFHFFGIKGDSNRIREAITRMVERGRIGNITLVSNYHLFDENPPLNLLDMTINQKSAIREDSEFVISCTAQGSSRMQFQWFKDGAIVNASKATREIWTTVLPPETKDVFTAILGVTKANRMDEGIYTCKVTDWGVTQCRSLHIHIKSPPRLRVDPASVTLHRGDSLRVRCLSPGNDDIKRYAQLGYSWTRNGVLFQSDAATVMWEDLYPDGSILKINNIQKSAEYSCIVSNTVKPVSKSVYITVIDRNAVQVCHAETLYGVRWPTSAPGAAIVSDCPRGFEGHTRRVCEQRDAGNSSWLLPDFSLCIRDQLLEIYNRFRALSSGFQKSNSSAILKSCFEYTIRRHKHFLPGEAGFLIDMLHEVDSYLQLKGTQLEREMAAEIILHILDKVMQNAQSLNSQQQIKKLQLLTQSAALNRETIAASQLATSTSTSAASSSAAGNAQVSSSASSSSSSASATQADTAASSSSSSSLSPSSTTTITTANNVVGIKQQHGSATLSKTDSSFLTVDEDSLSLDRLNSLRIYMTSVKMLPFNLRIYGDDLFSDQLYMDIGLSPRLLNIMANSTIFTSVISYKNLKSFLPKTYYTRGSDPKETDYILASRIIQTWLFQSNRSNDNFREPLDLSFEAGHVEIIFQHESAPKDSDWVAVCGHDYKASFESTWRSDLCITKNLMENITRCICPLSGTYVVMLTKRNHNSSVPHPPNSPLFVIISCACCLLQSCSAFIILLPIWFNRKCAITFLKMQFCVSTSSIMVIFLLGFLKMLPVNWQAIISSSLASLLLLGISTLIAIALVIHSELVPKKCLHVGNRTTTSTTATTNLAKKEHQQEMEKRHNSTSGGSGSISVTNITQISSNSSTTTATTNNTMRRSTTPPSRMSNAAAASADVNFPAASGRRGAIGISWLLPLLFAITSPLICSIIGKWPRNWWLEIMTASVTTTATSTTEKEGADADDGTGSSYFRTHHMTAQFNGDSRRDMLMNPATNGKDITSSAATTTTSLSTSVVAATTTTTSSFSSTWSHPHNVFSTEPLDSSYSSSSADAAAGVDDDGIGDDVASQAAPSLSFIIFICVDLLFILLFFALFAILIKKLLWLWHKNRNAHPHPLDKFNIAMGRRIGLLYRAGGLLLMKLSTDALFIAYVNSTQDSLWSYPFGISCILLGFAILFCFVLKAECNLRGPASGGSDSGSGALKKKLSSSKTSLDENYCTGSINSPLSFYTNHEKEKENESGAPPMSTLLPSQHIDISAGVQLPLTIISTAPRCQMMSAAGPMGMMHEHHASSVETFLSVGSLDRKAVLPQHMQQQQHLLKGATMAAASSPATRCCNILGSGGSGGGGHSGSQTQTLPHGMIPTGSMGYYDAYGGVVVGMTGSLGRRVQQQQKQAHATHEFVGVETLDILQGVAPDSIIGIRASNMLPATQQYHHHQQQQHLPQHHKPYVDGTILPPVIVSISGLTATGLPNYNTCSNNMASTTITTTSVTTQTPKAQKRVTIMEPTTHTSHTFDPLLPTMVAVSSGSSVTSTTIPTPIITITCSSMDEANPNLGGGSGAETTNTTANNATVTTADPTLPPASASCNSSPDDDNSINGMYDRITHDLDYLLNRNLPPPPPPRLMSDCIDDDIPPPPLPPSGSIPVEATTSTMTATSVVNNRQHGVIIEESEQEL